MPHVHELPVGQLTEENAVSLVQRQLRSCYGVDADIAPSVARQLADRAQGNPFFLIELARFLYARHIDPGDERAVASLDLPRSVSRLVLARLAQLSEAEMLTIKVASAIGSQFPEDWIRGSLPELGTAEQVVNYLQRLEKLNMIRRRPATTSSLEYSFDHAITRDVVYDTLTFEQREDLHGRIGAFIEQAYQDSLSEWVDALAYHYRQTKNVAKQQRWIRSAADAAKAAFANEAAIEHYQRVVPMLPWEATADVWLELGTTHHLIGNWQEAGNAYREAMRVARRIDASAVLATAMGELGALLAYTESYTEAIKWLTSAVTFFEELGDLRGLSKALDRLAFTYYQQGIGDKALTTAERHLAVATQAGDPAGVSAALDTIGLVHRLARRDPQASDALGRSLATAVQAGDRRAVIHAANDLAGFYAERGDHVNAVKYLREAIEAAKQIGYRWAIAVAIGNMGELHLVRGSLKSAADCFAYALRTAVELGDWTSMASRVGSLGTTAAERGDHSTAITLLNHAVTLAQLLDAPYFIVEWLYQTAKVQTKMGSFESAMRLNDKAHRIATRSGDRDVQWRTQLLAIDLARSLGHIDKHVAVRQLKDLNQAWTDPAGQVATLTAICSLEPADDGLRETAVGLIRRLYEQAPTSEYRQAYQRLTGQTLPPPPALPPLATAELSHHIDFDVLLLGVEMGIMQVRAASRRSTPTV
jgi:tetratricopeptide (TPR) repeat protein